LVFATSLPVDKLHRSKNIMPRLVGKRSNKGVIYAGVLFVLAIATFGVLEYTGAVDVIPNFGKSTKPDSLSPTSTTEREVIR
jgi:hypothetical protein